MSDGTIGFSIVVPVGLVIALIAGYFSPGGLKSITTFHYWSVVIGTITPAALFWLVAYTGRGKSDNPGLLMMFVLLVFLADLFVGSIAGFYLKSPTSVWLRMAIGFVFGAITMVWTLWAK